MPKRYLLDFFESLEKQTYLGFDIIVLNDNCDVFKGIKGRYSSLNIIDLDVNGSPAKNREAGINYAINNNYDKLMFADSDDCFSRNRVECSMALLDSWDIVVNDLALFDDRGLYNVRYMSNRISNGSLVTPDFILEKNILGFTNTAINLSGVERVSFSSDIIAVDWFFFTSLLLSGAQAIFTNDCLSYYRQHEESLIGMEEFSVEKLKKGLLVKMRHYREFPEFGASYEEISRISKMDVDHLYRKLMAHKVCWPFWWEEIREVLV